MLQPWPTILWRYVLKPNKQFELLANSPLEEGSDTVITGCTSDPQSPGCTLSLQSSVGRFGNHKIRTVCWECSLFIRFRTYFQGTVSWGRSLFIRFLNLPPGNCLPGVKHVYTISEPTSRGLFARGTARLYGILTYLQGTVHWGCILFIRFPNLPAGDCRSEVQPVFTVSEPTPRRLLARVVACLYGLWIYLKGPVHLWCSLFIKFPNLHTMDCRPEVQPFNTVSEPTSKGE